ncbi:hypothetical protein L6R53_13325 [Myxococcota bacterium]|nr:hypothetical protein [Myxococcota bacterium]
MIISLLLLACEPATTADPSGDSGAAASEWDGNTGPYLTEGEEDPAPDVDLEALGLSLSDALAHLLDYTARDVVSAYQAVTDGMDGDCPEWFESEGLPYWYDSCQSADGTRFEGYAYLVPLSDYVDTDGTVYDGSQLYGIASVVDEDGRAFQARGGAGIFDATTLDGARVSYSYMEAGFSDSAAEGTWLADALDPALVTWTAWYEEVDGRATSVDGTVTGMTGGIEVLVLDQVVLSDEALAGCALEPSATLSVLDGEGQWLDLVFAAEGPEDPGCDGCGTAWAHGQSLGTVCADFTTLLDWEQSPWW